MTLGKLIAPKSSAIPFVHRVPARARAVSRAFFLRAKADAYAILLAAGPTYVVYQRRFRVQWSDKSLTAFKICLIGP